jgi:hypothetical protein
MRSYFLSFVCAQDQIEIIKNCYSETRICNNNQDCISFCKDIAREWIIETQHLLDDRIQSKENQWLLKSQDNIRKENIRSLLNYCCTDCDAQIYSYFLYFCGILSPITKEEEDKFYRDALRKFFEQKIRDAKDGNRRLLFSF